MRQLFVIPLIMLMSSPVWAQAYYAEQTYPPAPQSVPQVYAGQPTSAPYDPYARAPQTQTAQPQPVASQPPRPGEYGQSVMTDIRQMNF